jgi:hypothetical protein
MSKKPGIKQKLLAKYAGQEINGLSIENSFLNETSFNSDVDIEIRQEIEKKFKKSSVNSNYVFPRNNPSTENKRKKTPVKVKPTPRSKLLMEKSLPVMHKMTKSTQDSTGILANLYSLKKMHRVSSSIRSMKDTKLKISKGRNTPVLSSHNRTVSQNLRSKTPVLSRKENSVDQPSR